MKTKNIKLPVLKCRRCGHEWVPRYPQVPLRCAKCRSSYWQRERKR